MILGEWRDGFPRFALTLVGEQGQQRVDFVVDTGSNGDIALPENLIRQLGILPTATHFVELAGGFRRKCLSYELLLEWDGEERLGEERLVEVLTRDGSPLLGNNLWRETFLHAENTLNGEVFFEAF